MKNQKGRVPLFRAISKLGHASRTEAVELIKNKNVKVHGKIETDPKRMVNPDTAHIEILNKKAIKEEIIILALNKPTGYLTTKRDPEGRPTVYELLPTELQHLHAIGRLDYHTSGLLLFTNDTQFSSHLTDPTHKILRTYVVQVRGFFGDEQVEQAKKGVIDDGQLLQAKNVEVLKESAKESQIKIILTEGKNREIRRMCKALGCEVIKLKRIQFGAYELGDLASGKTKRLSRI